MGGERQAAAVRAAGQDALEALRLDWGGVYFTDYSPGLGWWAVRRDLTGAFITVGSPEELGAAVAEDYGPVRS
jgi:hypothetical protein